MDFISLVAFSATSQQRLPEPSLWLRPNGKITIKGKVYAPRIAPGAFGYMTPQGYVYDFDGARGGLHFEDLGELKITGSMTVAVWIHPRSYVNDGPGAQILFRGDDRNGHDPYTLVVHHDGTIHFGIQNEKDRGASVGAELPLNMWSQIVAHWDARASQLKMWLNGDLISTTRTSRAPFAELDNAWAPGVSVGNVQNDSGPHNQPFNGMLHDLRLYRGAFEPEDLKLQASPTGMAPLLLIQKAKRIH